jgi:hypothetical protein
MAITDIVNRHFNGDYIKPMDWDNCLRSRKELYDLLQCWVKITKVETLGDLNEVIYAGTQLIRLMDRDVRYVINYDTRRNGVVEFLKNSEQNERWFVSSTNRVSNHTHGKHIENMHMYKYR